MKKNTSRNCNSYKNYYIYSFSKFFFNTISIILFCGIFNTLLAENCITKVSKVTSPISIQKWLVAGPINCAIDTKNGLSKRTCFNNDYLIKIGGESRPIIKDGTTIISPNGDEIKFKFHNWDTDYLDIVELFGKLKNVYSYLYTELESTCDQNIIVHLGSNDGCKLWGNSKLLTSYYGNRVAKRSQNTVEFNLKKGINKILLKVDQAGGNWGAFIELYGKSAHKDFLHKNLPQKLDLQADNQLPLIGDTVKAFISKYAELNWFELSNNYKWELEDSKSLIKLNSNSDTVVFVVPEGKERLLKLHVSKKLGNKNIKSTLNLFARKLNVKIIGESDSICFIGNKRELFVDHFLISKLINTKLIMHKPRDEGIAFYFDKPWESKFSAYCTILKDDNTFRAYYRGAAKHGVDGNEGEITCYAESNNGINWYKPNINLFEIMGEKNNNVILANDVPFSHNFSPFIDKKPGISKEAKYKSVAGTIKSGLWSFESKDGIHWKRMGSEPIFTGGIFDSQNVVFWSESENCYVCYFRVWSGNGFSGVRSIGRATSPDLIYWSNPERMEFGYTPLEHLYTNQTSPYFRAPHIYISIAARFLPKKTIINSEEAKEIKLDKKYYENSNGCSDAIFMSSRGSNKYDRTFLESFIRPSIGLNNWVSRTNYPALNVIQTGQNEMSIYVNQDYAQPTAHLRRYSLRLDGFSSINAPYTGGEFITKAINFSGNQLEINYSTSAAGFIKVEVLDIDSKPLEGYELFNCDTIIGNEIKKIVSWKNNTNIESKNKIIKLRFVMKDADLFSLKFN